jgi:hypothetical protein
MKAVSKQALITNLEARIEQHLQMAIATYQNLSADKLLKPAPNNGWSMAQCLEHLNSYGRYYLPAIKNAMKKAPDQPHVKEFKSTWLGNYFTNLMEPGAKMKTMKAPKDHQPSPDLDPSRVVAEFIEQQETLLRLLRSCARKDMNKIKVPISIAKWLRLRVGDVFRFLVAHNERHIVQAEKLR